jgi:hypothetical protein
MDCRLPYRQVSMIGWEDSLREDGVTVAMATDNIPISELFCVGAGALRCRFVRFAAWFYDLLYYYGTMYSFLLLLHICFWRLHGPNGSTFCRP